ALAPGDARPGYGEVFLPGVVPAAAAPEDGASMLALCEGVLRAVEIQVTPMGAGRVRVAAPCRATMLVRGVPTLTPGRVRTATVREGHQARTSPYGPLSVTIELGRERWRIRRVRLGSTGYRLDLRG